MFPDSEYQNIVVEEVTSRNFYVKICVKICENKTVGKRSKPKKMFFIAVCLFVFVKLIIIQKTFGFLSNTLAHPYLPVQHNTFLYSSTSQTVWEGNTHDCLEMHNE